MSKRANGKSSAVGIGAAAGDKGQTKQAQLLSADAGHFSMIRALHMADYITTMNCFCGIMSIFSSMRYCLGDPLDKGNMWAALALMPLGLFFDFFDGKVARWRKKSSLMGQELDSLADLVSFGAAPASCAFALGMRTPVDHVLLTLFVLCGLLRLARFNVTVAQLPKDATGKSKYFEGTPIPTSLTIAGLMAWWVHKGYLGDAIPGGVYGAGAWFEFHPAALLFLAHGCMMISRTLKIPKP